MSEFWRGALFALVIGVFANLITPMTRAVLITLFVRLGNGVRALGKWGIRRALANSEKELLELDDYHSNPAKFSSLAINILSHNLFVLWVIAIAISLTIFGNWVPSLTMRGSFFGLLGGSTSILGQLLAILNISSHLQSYEKYRAIILKRIESLRAALENNAS